MAKTRKRLVDGGVKGETAGVPDRPACVANKDEAKKKKYVKEEEELMKYSIVNVINIRKSILFLYAKMDNYLTETFCRESLNFDVRSPIHIFYSYLFHRRCTPNDPVSGLSCRPFGDRPSAFSPKRSGTRVHTSRVWRPHDTFINNIIRAL